MKTKLTLAALVCVISMFATVQVVSPINGKNQQGKRLELSLAGSTVIARPHPVRRRIVRRHNVRGCLWRTPYWVCGGYYYVPRIVKGKTVYVIVDR